MADSTLNPIDLTLAGLKLDLGNKAIELAISPPGQMLPHDHDPERGQDEEGCKELWAWIFHRCREYTGRPQSVRDLNLAIRFITGNEKFDTEAAIQQIAPTALGIRYRTSSKLDLILREQGFVLNQKLDFRKIDYKWDGAMSHDGKLTEDKGSEHNGALENEKKVKLSKDLLGTYRAQQTTYVFIRDEKFAASLKDPLFISNGWRLNSTDGKLRVSKAILRIFFQGPDLGVDKEIWQYCFHVFRTTLEELDHTTASEADTIEIATSLLSFFYSSENVRKYFANNLPTFYEFSWVNFGGVGGTSLLRDAVIRWFDKALALEHPSFSVETTAWMLEISRSPIKLLHPFAETLCREWLQKKADEYFDAFNILQMAVRFMQYTDLPPQGSATIDLNDFVDDACETIPPEQLEIFWKVWQIPKTLHNLCRKSMAYAYCGDGEKAVSTFREALYRFNERTDEITFLQTCLCGIVDTLQRSSIMNKSIALVLLSENRIINRSNAQYYRQLGSIYDYMGQRQDAMSAYQKSLNLKPNDSETSRELITLMMLEDDYDGVMELLEHHGAEVCSSWFRGEITEHEDVKFYPMIFGLAAKAGKLELISRALEMCVENQEDTKEMNGRETAIIALVFLGQLHVQYTGNGDKAFGIFQKVFFEDFILMHLSFHHVIFRDASFIFVDLIYKQVVSPSTTLAERDNMILLLEGVIKQTVVLNKVLMDKPNEFDDDFHYLSRVLIKLYLFASRNVEAENLAGILMDELFQSITLKYPQEGTTMRHLAQMLSLYGKEFDARVAMCLVQLRESRRLETRPPRDENGEEIEIEDNDDDEAGFRCSGYHQGERRYAGVILWELARPESIKPMFTCTTCINVNFCKDCHDRYIVNGGTDDGTYFICSPSHNFLKLPVDEWSLKPSEEYRILKRRMKIHEEEIIVTHWLRRLELAVKTEKMVLRRI